MGGIRPALSASAYNCYTTGANSYGNISAGELCDMPFYYGGTLYSTCYKGECPIKTDWMRNADPYSFAPCRCSSESCSTAQTTHTDGTETIAGYPCMFPFEYNGFTYNGC